MFIRRLLATKKAGILDGADGAIRRALFDEKCGAGREKVARLAAKVPRSRQKPARHGGLGPRRAAKWRDAPLKVREADRNRRVTEV